MAFVDEIEIRATAGRGGDGMVRWRHLKGKEFSGPSGGDGGKGGNIYARAVRDILVLSKYQQHKEFLAENGEHGGKNSMHGKDGASLYIDIPIGSIITEGDSGSATHELVEEGEEILLLKGGKGGYGNEYFKSSTNTSPTEHTRGANGQSSIFHIELQLIADAGLIGLPNAGKSSLLNVLTGAKAKVGSYAFTTLDPNLGELYGFILADIPGLIEGASKGKGLGHKFLRHIRRTRVLFHCISLEQKDLVQVYRTVREELTAYDSMLTKKLGHPMSEKPEVIILTKSDEVSPEETAHAKKMMGKFSDTVFSVTILDDSSVKMLRDQLTEFLRKNQ